MAINGKLTMGCNPHQIAILWVYGLVCNSCPIFRINGLKYIGFEETRYLKHYKAKKSEKHKGESVTRLYDGQKGVFYFIEHKLIL